MHCSDIEKVLLFTRIFRCAKFNNLIIFLLDFSVSKAVIFKEFEIFISIEFYVSSIVLSNHLFMWQF